MEGGRIEWEDRWEDRMEDRMEERMGYYSERIGWDDRILG